jgi:hypothetical protein
MAAAGGRDNPRRPGVARPTRVDLIEARPVFDIGDIDVPLHELRNAAAGAFERCPKIGQHLLGLNFERRHQRRFSPCALIGNCPETNTKPFAIATWL